MNGGLEAKLEMNDFVECMNDYDVLFLSECWVNESHQIELDGYAQPFCKFRGKNVKKRFGRIMCLFSE